MNQPTAKSEIENAARLHRANKEFNALVATMKEFQTATAKFGAFNSTHEGYAVLLEEIDELWDEVKANDRQRATVEAIQVAAMALRFLVDCGDFTTITAMAEKATQA